MKTTAASRRGVRTGNEDDGSVRTRRQDGHEDDGSVTTRRQDAASGRYLQDDAASGRSVMTVRL
jgi:hypothetical protein